MVWFEIGGIRLPLRHSSTSLIWSDAFRRQISVSGDLLLWLRIAFGGDWSLFWQEKKTSYNMGLFIHCGEEDMLFRSLVLIMGQVVLDAFSHLRLRGGVGVRGSPDFKPFHFLRGLVEPLDLPHSRHRQAPAIPYFPSMCGILGFPIATESIFPITGLLWQQLLSCRKTDF